MQIVGGRLACPLRRTGISPFANGTAPCSGASGRCGGFHSWLAKNPRHIPAVMLGVVSIGGNDIGEFHGPSF